MKVIILKDFFQWNLKIYCKKCWILLNKIESICNKSKYMIGVKIKYLKMTLKFNKLFNNFKKLNANKIYNKFKKLSKI